MNSRYAIKEIQSTLRNFIYITLNKVANYNKEKRTIVFIQSAAIVESSNFSPTFIYINTYKYLPSTAFDGSLHQNRNINTSLQIISIIITWISEKQLDRQ